MYSLYVFMSAGNSERLVLFVFFNSTLKDNFFSTVLLKIINFQNRGFEPYWMIYWMVSFIN